MFIGPATVAVPPCFSKEFSGWRVRAQKIITMNYTPIDCNLYDVYEAYATLGLSLRIRYLENEEEHVISSKIKTLVTENKEEFLILENAMKIRLDKVLNCMPEN